VSEQFLNGTSAQRGYLVPFMVHTIHQILKIVNK